MVNNNIFPSVEILAVDDISGTEKFPSSAPL
jgi:hypothetical protein